VILQAPEALRQTPADLDRVRVRSRTTGQLIPLTALVAQREVGSPKELKRVDRRAAVTVTGGLAPGVALGDAVEITRAAVARTLPANAALSWTGQAKEYVATASGQWLMFGAALLVVFLALAAQFESWIHPAIILAAVPPAFAGAVLALHLAGISLNIYSKVGIVMLIGLMAKNGILLVEFANQLRNQGVALAEAARQAAVIRLRPIVMTSIATVAGAVPLVITGGAGAEGRAAIGVVIIGGVTLATLITLFLVPVLYQLFAGFTRPSGHRQRELALLERQHPATGTDAEAG
jgi:multidrug efflux pump